jgi:hypothetical protein
MYKFNRSTVQPFNRSTVQPFNRSTVQPFNRSTCVSYKESERKRKYKQHKEHHGMVDPSFLMEQTTSIHENCQTGIAGIMG